MFFALARLCCCCCCYCFDNGDKADGNSRRPGQINIQIRMLCDNLSEETLYAESPFSSRIRIPISTPFKSK